MEIKKIKRNEKIEAVVACVIKWILLPVWVVYVPFVALRTAWGWWGCGRGSNYSLLWNYREALRFEANCLVHALTGNYNIFIF